MTRDKDEIKRQEIGKKQRNTEQKEKRKIHEKI